MTCKCIHHPERWVCRSIQEGNYIFPNAGGMLAGWLAGWLTGCVLPGWWCIGVPTCCSRTQKSASPSILARFSSHGYQKVLEFTGGLENAARIVDKCTKSTTPINPRSKETYKTWLLVLRLGCTISLSVHDLQVHPSSREVGVQINPRR